MVGLPSFGIFAVDAKYSYVEHNGYLEEEDESSNIHVATLTFEGAQRWCDGHSKCRGFTHIGGPIKPSDDVEFFFKDMWSLAVDEEEQWTSYKRSNSAEPGVEETSVKQSISDMITHCEIQTCSG
jgi:hypothetical protein